MTRRQGVRGGAMLAVVLLLLAPAQIASGARALTVTHSGVILTVNREAGTFVLGEVGPWRVKGGVTVITERTVVVTPSTEFRRVKRAAGPGPGGWFGEFVEAGLGAWEIRNGDFVTVEVQRDGERLTALKVVVLTPSTP